MRVPARLHTSRLTPRVSLAGDGSGHYERDAQGVHHLAPPSVVGRDMNEDAYGCLEVYDDKLKLEMIGTAPDATRLPNGWPAELPLPTGGALVAGGDAAAFGFFLSFMLFMLNMISMPLQPVFRMLTSTEPEGDDDPASGVEAGEGPPDDGASGDGGAAAIAVASSSGGGGGTEPAKVSASAEGNGDASTESGTPASGEMGVVV